MQKLRVLVVDDEEALRNAFKRVLEARGMEVVGVAKNGEEAIEMARDLDADVVLTDLRMPVMDGIQAAREISAQESPPVIIILSAYADPSLQDEAREAGASAWLKKGSPPRELCAQVIEVANAAVD